MFAVFETRIELSSYSTTAFELCVGVSIILSCIHARILADFVVVHLFSWLDFKNCFPIPVFCFSTVKSVQ